jgi:predicted DNA-binding transcriptional regulator AlpA
MTNQTPARAMTLAEAAELPIVLDLPTAARLLGIGRTAAYQIIGAGTLPVPVLRLGHLIRIPTAPLLHLLGLPVPGDVGDTRPARDDADGADSAPNPDAAPIPDGPGVADDAGGRAVAAGQDARPNRWTRPDAGSGDGVPGPADFPPHRSDDHGLPGAAAGPEPGTRKDVTES